MLNLDNIIDLPVEKVKELNDIIEQKRAELKEKNLYINRIPREDIFNILDNYCTVVFYPLPAGESNDGFHVTMPVDYNDCGEEHFVFLNTAKHREKQVFAAAHELGHIWVEEDIFWDDTLEQMLPREKKENVDAVMNCFAAELLMPREIFQRSAYALLQKFDTGDHKISYIDLFRAVACLMDEFCVPAQAVICRFYEVQLLEKNVCQELLTGPRDQKLPIDYSELFGKMVELCVQEGGYTGLLKNSEKRGIREFPEVLNEVEQKGLFSEQTIAQLREVLDLPKIRDEGEMPIAPINIKETE